MMIMIIVNGLIILIIGTNAVCRIFVPVCPKLFCVVFPHPEMIAFLPTRFIG